MTATLPSEVDFPAAHSMDTNWFAVDRDGHVAMFDSGKLGAVPTELTDSVGQEDSLVLEAIEPLPVIAEPMFSLAAVFHPGLRTGASPRRRRLFEGWPNEGWAHMLLFRDE